MARIQVDEPVFQRAKKLGIQPSWFCNRKLREECERMEYDRKSEGKD